jgi:hypothetical protein
VAAPTCLFYNNNNTSSLNLNDGTTYTIVGDVVLGPKAIKTWDEYRSYSGSVAQYNVSTANIIDMSMDILVASDSVANLRTALAAINTKIDDIAAGTTHFVYDGITYHLMSSPNIEWVEDGMFRLKFKTVVTLNLKRTA